MEQKPTGENPGNAQTNPEIIISSPSTGSIDPTPNKICPSCGTANSAGSAYCYKCGVKLPDAAPPDKKICAGCGAPNSLSSQYCYKCGLQLPVKVGGNKEMKFGGFGERLIAFIINGILSGILIIIVFSFIIASKYDVSTLNEMADNMRTAGVVDSRIWSIMGILLLTFLIVTVLYSTISIGIWGRTIGKAVFKLKVVKPDGSHIGIIRAFGRSIAYILNYCTLGLSFIVIALTHKKRGIHDYIADTIVIKTD
jgi:uncharacterized RDD family membrane protein YckC/ribosomal protein L40E